MDYNDFIINDLEIEKTGTGEYQILGELEADIKGQPVTIVSAIFKVKKLADNYYIWELTIHNAKVK